MSHTAPDLQAYGLARHDSLTVEGLDAPIGRHVGRLRLWPGTLSVGAALLEISRVEALVVLEQLLRADLLDCVGEEHYRLFGPAGDHASALTASIDPGEQKAALARAIHQCLRGAR